MNDCVCVCMWVRWNQECESNIKKSSTIPICFYHLQIRKLRCLGVYQNDERIVINNVCWRHDPTLSTQHREVSEWSETGKQFHSFIIRFVSAIVYESVNCPLCSFINRFLTSSINSSDMTHSTLRWKCFLENSDDWIEYVWFQMWFDWFSIWMCFCYLICLDITLYWKVESNQCNCTTFAIDGNWANGECVKKRWWCNWCCSQSSHIQMETDCCQSRKWWWRRKTTRRTISLWGGWIK